MQEGKAKVVSLYVVKTANGDYFAGFDASKGAAVYSTDPLGGKMFTNKFDIKLRPDENVVELKIDLQALPTNALTASEPFRPHNRRPAVKQ